MALALAGCKVNEPEQKLGLPLSICLPANEVQSARYAPAARRAIGDPGETELFLFPLHLYIIVMKQDNTTKVWSVWHAEERTLTDADWEPKHYSGPLPTMEDSIYQYTEQINLPLTAGGSKFYGRVYAVASAERLNFNKTWSSGITSLDDLLSLTFNTSGVQSSLQHIYSSPYNLTLNGDYYGSFNSNLQRVPYVNLLLYHIAAKVDIKWNVEEEKRINKADRENAVRLTYMEARNLFNGNAYCFKPMRNVSGSALTSGATVKIAENDEGLWWEGRSYFYTIPYTITAGGKQYYPLQMTLKTNGSTETGYQPTLNLQVDTTAKFVPWLRANFNLTAPLENKTETKTVDN
ncbi:MAG: hypothetical protein IJ047_01510 [Paludibacteraceae bacterium]|nr:hypothetical protein [Paludibacteraceae bacterium]